MELTIDGRKVHYTDSGEGRTLLVLQGWAAPADLYTSVAKRLEGKMRVVIPDMPGFGATPEPEEAWGSEDYARFVRRFLAALGIEEAYVMGHSVTYLDHLARATTLQLRRHGQAVLPLPLRLPGLLRARRTSEDGQSHGEACYIFIQNRH